MNVGILNSSRDFFYFQTSKDVVTQAEREREVRRERERR
jgi:hypothetical protein